MNEILWLFLLLPVAAASGWYLAAFRSRGKVRQSSRLSRNYFRGLNYLLNEESDKAIELFMEIAEVNRDTVETHLALGKLFRRRGEMDKAIRFHKHIISRPNLSDDQRGQALMALGEDYMQAGLLDRAERLFSELLVIAPGDPAPVRQLLAIYQQEKDWAKAIDMAAHLGTEKDDVRQMVAQFHCEQAEMALADDDADRVMSALRQARRYDPKHPRSRLLEAALAHRRGQWLKVGQLLREACELEPGCLVGSIDKLLESHRRTDMLDQLMSWLGSMVDRHRSTTATLALAELLLDDDPEAALAVLLEQLAHRPSVKGLEHLMALLHEQKVGFDRVEPERIRDLARSLLKGQPSYRCSQCGFSGNSLHWLCPSCRQWNTTRAITGVLGE